VERARANDLIVSINSDNDFLDLLIPNDAFATQQHNRTLDRAAKFHDRGDVTSVSWSNANLAGSHEEKVIRPKKNAGAIAATGILIGLA
jgi:hypothetical protein